MRSGSSFFITSTAAWRCQATVKNFCATAGHSWLRRMQSLPARSRSAAARPACCASGQRRRRLLASFRRFYNVMSGTIRTFACIWSKQAARGRSRWPRRGSFISPSPSCSAPKSNLQIIRSHRSLCLFFRTVVTRSTLAARWTSSVWTVCLSCWAAARATFEAACRLARITPNVRFEGNAPHTLAALAEAGYGVAIVPGTLMVRSKRLRISRLQFRGELVVLPLSVQWDDRRPLPLYAQDFPALFSAHVRSMLHPPNANNFVSGRMLARRPALDNDAVVKG